MNHIAEALRLNERSKVVLEAIDADGDYGRQADRKVQAALALAQQAQVHATLALVQATVG